MYGIMYVVMYGIMDIIDVRDGQDKITLSKHFKKGVFSFV